jgi:hypothetical protein
MLEKYENIWKMYGVFGFSIFSGTVNANAGSIGGDLTSILWLSLLIVNQPEKDKIYSSVDQINYNYFLVKWSRSILTVSKMINGHIFLLLNGERVYSGGHIMGCTHEGGNTPEGDFTYEGRVVPLIHNYDQFFFPEYPNKPYPCVKALEIFLNKKGYADYVGPVIYKDE